MERHPLARLRDINVKIEWDEDAKSWVTYVPELDNISTFGRTQEEALDNTSELIFAHITTAQDLGLRLPLGAAAIRRILAAVS